MPTYVYHCKEHGDFDKVTSIAEHQRVQDCPVCGEDSPQVIRETNIDSFFEGSVRKQHWLEH